MTPKDPEKRRKQLQEWRKRGAKNYEKRLKAEGRRFSKLRRRGVMERYKDDPDRYGDAFLGIRELPCFARRYLPGSECGLGYAPASAHHLGEKDSEGLVPCCGKHHDMMEEREKEVESMLKEAGSPPLKEIGRKYVQQHGVCNNGSDNR